MHRILTFYILRQLASAFVFATGAVTFVVLFAQSFHLLSVVVENAATALVFFKLLGLSALTFLPLIMPLALGVAVVFIYNKLASDSELVVMRTAGFSLWRLLEPALILAVCIAVFCASMTLWLTPAANRSLVQLQYKMRNSYSVFLSNPGSFNDLSNGLTFYANRRGSGGALEGILIQDVRQPEKTVTTMAATGRIVEDAAGPRMIIFNGRRQELDRATGKLTELAFDQYVLDLDALRQTTSKRYPDPRELGLFELINPSPELLRARGPLSRFLGEFHTRIATPLLSFSFVFIALAAVLAGAFNRRGMAKRILISALAMIVTQAVFMTLAGLIARDSALTLLLYMAAILPGLLGFGVLTAGGLRLRFWRGRSRKGCL